ncbi:DUF2846 domain-containing protein [Neptuniibacter sp.]|uniref:DUF2846 domain-containing protein n=1 Tax=Neptuniibacter sp. TaxID=1962643 RepID=UPI00260295D5|nr:DUF2846 domain-containing protein [Neptuniibacter sp.]MCP4596356.1 DUF2846 domain-containing protein [Neptuniibacter sp.]
MLIRCLYLVSFIICLQGCVAAGKGKAFQSIEYASSQEAILYLYRDDDTADFRKPDILINGKQVTELPNKTYYRLVLAPGRYNIQTKWAWDVEVPPIDYDLELVGGETYFVRLWAGSKDEGLIITGIPSYPVMPDMSFFSAAFLQTEDEAIPVLSKTRAVSAN